MTEPNRSTPDDATRPPIPATPAEMLARQDQAASQVREWHHMQEIEKIATNLWALHEAVTEHLVAALVRVSADADAARTHIEGQRKHLDAMMAEIRAGFAERGWPWRSDDEDGGAR